MENKLVSILIPVYNRENLIRETVLSALSQTYKNIEIILVDNQSTDKTWDVIQKLNLEDDRIKIFQNDINVGPLRNWQRCINEAKGEYCKILWSDDLIASTFLEKTLPFLNNEDVGFVFSGVGIFTDNIKENQAHYFIGNSGIYDKEKFINGILFETNYPVSPGCSLFRLKDIKKNLLLNIPNKLGINFTKEAIGNDLLLFLLTLNDYKNFGFVNEQLSYFRAHEGSISIQSKSGKLDIFYLFAKAHYVENYESIEKTMYLNMEINNILNKYDASIYNINCLQDFYMKNRLFQAKEYPLKTNIKFYESYNKFYYEIEKLINNNDDKYIVYGNGSLGKTIQLLIPNHVVGYVDISDKNNHPQHLKTMIYDKIIISVLGREESIIRYLVNKLNIEKEKIVTLEIRK